jgi:hypothetical protein
VQKYDQPSLRIDLKVILVHSVFIIIHNFQSISQTSPKWSQVRLYYAKNVVLSSELLRLLMNIEKQS